VTALCRVSRSLPPPTRRTSDSQPTQGRLHLPDWGHCLELPLTLTQFQWPSWWESANLSVAKPSEATSKFGRCTYRSKNGHAAPENSMRRAIWPTTTPQELASGTTVRCRHDSQAAEARRYNLLSRTNAPRDDTRNDPATPPSRSTTRN
jgi:hypothetical protein